MSDENLKTSFIYFFKSIGCKYCENFNPVKSEFKEKYGKDNAFVQMDCSSNESILKLAKDVFQVKTVPCIVVVDHDNSFDVYSDISTLNLPELEYRLGLS